MNPLRWVRLFFARRAARVATARAHALRTEIDARIARIHELHPGSDARGLMAASVYLDLPLVWQAEDTAKRARDREAFLNHPMINNED